MKFSNADACSSAVNVRPVSVNAWKFISDVLRGM